MNVTPEQQKIIDAFDEATKKRARELLTPSNAAASSMRKLLDSMRESAFCLGYKAGVIDLSAEQRGVDAARAVFIERLLSLYAAACAWQDAESSPKALERLIAAINETRQAFS